MTYENDGKGDFFDPFDTETEKQRRIREATCSCGSGKPKQRQNDGHGIFLCYTCPDCEQEKMGRFRPDIHERYERDEPIDED